AIFVGLNVCALLAGLTGAPLHDIEVGRALYAVVLFLLCSLPLLSMNTLNGRFFLLAVFMLLYFLFFGAMDLQALVIGEELHPARADFLEPAEVAILSGAVLVLVGYFAGVSLGGHGEDARRPAKEWSKQVILLLG